MKHFSSDAHQHFTVRSVTSCNLTVSPRATAVQSKDGTRFAVPHFSHARDRRIYL